MIQYTLILVKPDGVRRALTGEILTRFERAGLKIIALKMVQVSRDLAESHYTYEDIALKHGEKVRNRLLKYIVEGPLVAAVLEGCLSIEVVRKLAGSTEPRAALPGTIRGDYCHHSYALCEAADQPIHNVIHASANEEDAEREIALWFTTDELHLSYRRSDENEHLFIK